jgi:hypothetical protein
MRVRRDVAQAAILAIGVLVGIRSAGAQDQAATADVQAGAYARVVDEYMQGKWDDLQKDLSPRNPDLGTLTAGQKADVQYLRTTLSECRPPWWQQAKSGQEFNFEPAVWGRSLRASFDPGQTSSVSLSYNNGQASLTLKWDVTDMDSPAKAEHGFSKGELNDLSVWSSIGMGEAWTRVPVQSMVNMSDATKTQLQRYLDFNADVVGVYYATPRARRWGLWLFCAAYLNKYAAMVTVNSRKAVGSMFLGEVVAHRAKYPSIRLPDLPSEKIEENLCIQLKNNIEKHPWTLAEDRSLREALKSFAAFNQRSLLQTGVVRLPSGLPLALDPSADQADQVARDEWLKRALDRPPNEGN